MKRIIISLLAVLAFTSIPYLEYVLEQNLYASQLGDRDFIITSFLSDNMKKFHTADLLRIKDALNGMSDLELLALSRTDFKDPTISLVLSILVGGFGIDRFYSGDIGAGVGKTKKNNAEDLDETIMINQAIMAN